MSPFVCAHAFDISEFSTPTRLPDDLDDDSSVDTISTVHEHHKPTGSAAHSFTVATTGTTGTASDTIQPAAPQSAINQTDIPQGVTLPAVSSSVSSDNPAAATTFPVTFQASTPSSSQSQVPAAVQQSVMPSPTGAVVLPATPVSVVTAPTAAMPVLPSATITPAATGTSHDLNVVPTATSPVTAAQPDNQVPDWMIPPDERPKKKPSFLKRIRNTIFFWQKPDPLEDVDAPPPEPPINVKVNGAPDILEENLVETLKQISVEDFKDYQLDLPRFRSLAQDASQAVGYYNATFKFSKKDNKTLIVDVVPGDPVIVRSQKIEFTGDASKDNVFARIQSSPDLDVGDILNHGDYEKTKARISNLATERGYFKGHYLQHDVLVTLPERTADIALAYDSGVRYHFGKVIYKNSNGSDKLPLRLDLLQSMQPFKQGDPYNANTLARFSRNLLDTRYFNNVQVDAPTPEALPDDVPPTQDAASVGPDGQSAGIADSTGSGTAGQTGGTTAQSGSGPTSAQTQTGPQSGTTSGAASDKNMPADKSTNTGGVSNPSLIPATQSTTKPEDLASAAGTYEIPVIVQVNSDHPNSAEAGLGYGTDTGVRLRTQYRRALIHDFGDSFDANAEVSKIRHAVDVRYNIPVGNPLEDVVSVFSGYEDERVNETGGLDVNTKTMTVGVQRTFKPVGTWQRTYSLRYRLDQLENNVLDVPPSTLPPPFNVEGISTHQQALLAGFGLNKLVTKGGINPTSGFRQFYQIDVGTKAAFSDADMAIIRAGFHGMQTFDVNHQVLASLDLGTIVTPNFDNVPYNLRFFAGGDQSIRGFDYKSLSTLKNGYEIGGQNLAVGSLEYNYMFVPKWRAAVFVDAGNAFDKSFNDPIKVGTGLGIRWASPVGTVRVDVAAGVSERSIPVRLVFFIGSPL